MVEETQQSSQPAEGQQAPAGTAETTVSTPEQQPEASGEVTPESIEAYWRKRQSNSDRAHAEAERVLREQLATAEAAARAKVDAGAKDNDVVAELRRQNEQLQQQVRQTEAQRLVDTRRAMYPAAAEALADNNLVASMDEARLAALNAKLGDEAATPPPPRMDGNNPARGAQAPPKRLSDMSSDELKQVLEQNSAAWVEHVRNS